MWAFSLRGDDERFVMITFQCVRRAIDRKLYSAQENKIMLDWSTEQLTTMVAAAAACKCK